MIDIGKDLQRAYDDGYAQGTQAAVKWIPVTERLPKDEQEVLVYTIHHCYYTWVCHNKVEYWWEDEYGYCCDFDDVTHWMPLPEPPKDGET